MAVLSVPSITVGLACVVFLTLIKRRFFSPISDIPGPFWASFWIGWQLWHIVEGETEKQLVDLHRKHGLSLCPRAEAGCYGELSIF